MFARVLALAGGLAGGASLSQFPEFSQQYLQRLGGAVEALEQVVDDFDASAAAEGLSRDEALAQMQGSDFIERRREDMTRTFQRFDVLRGDLAALKDASAYERAFQATRFTDGEVAASTWDDFKPALPLTAEGGVFAGVGFLGGWALIAFVLGGLGWIWRKILRRPPEVAAAPAAATPPPPDAARLFRRD